MAAPRAAAAALTVFGFAIADQTQHVLSQSTDAFCGSQQADDNDDTAAELAQQEEEDQQQQHDDEQPPNKRNSGPRIR